MPKLMIATPAYGEVFYAPYVRSVLALSKLAHRDKFELVFESISYAEISEARNYLLTRFFDKTDATHLLFIDADMGFPAKLVSDMLSLAKPIVGVVAPKRQIDLKRVAELAKREADTDRAIARAHEFVVRKLPGSSFSPVTTNDVAGIERSRRSGATTVRKFRTPSSNVRTAEFAGSLRFSRCARTKSASEMMR